MIFNGYDRQIEILKDTWGTPEQEVKYYGWIDFAVDYTGNTFIMQWWFELQNKTAKIELDGSPFQYVDFNNFVDTLMDENDLCEGAYRFIGHYIYHEDTESEFITEELKVLHKC